MKGQNIKKAVHDASALATELARIELQVSKWRERLEVLTAAEGFDIGSTQSSVQPGASDCRPSPRTIQAALRQRAFRASIFGEGLFHDPAWDMLLDLYAAHIAHQRVSVTSACIGSGAPTSTALRWLKALERRGLVTRTDDPQDGTRSFIALTEKGVASMDAYFRSSRDRWAQFGMTDSAESVVPTDLL